MIPLPQSTEWWDYRHALLGLALREKKILVTRILLRPRRVFMLKQCQVPRQVGMCTQLGDFRVAPS